MKSAIEDKCLKVWLQPIYDISKQRFSYVEALIRLMYEDQMITPDRFIDKIQDQQMMDQISWFVLDHVCHFLKEHPDFPQSISINLTMNQLENENVIVKIDEMIKKYDIDRSRLKIEVTEQILSHGHESNADDH